MVVVSVAVVAVVAVAGAVSVVVVVPVVVSVVSAVILAATSVCSDMEYTSGMGLRFNLSAVAFGGVGAGVTAGGIR